VNRGNPPPENWPSNGAITFKDYSVRYRPGLDMVLQDINFDVKSQEKVCYEITMVISISG